MLTTIVHIGLAAPKIFLKDYFYKNGDADEMLFIHVGSGTLRTNYGNIPFKYGDYLIIPKGVIYQIDFDTEDNRILYVESFEPIFTPKRYRKLWSIIRAFSFLRKRYALTTRLRNS